MSCTSAVVTARRFFIARLHAEIAGFLVDQGADLDAQDADHASTPLQYLIGDAALATLLIERGARCRTFSLLLVLGTDCWWIDACATTHMRSTRESIARPSRAPAFTCMGGRSASISRLLDVARKFGHPGLADEMLARASLKTQFVDALWTGDRERAHALIARDPQLVKQLGPEEAALLPAAAWWYRPEAVRLMLEMGLDHTRVAHINPRHSIAQHSTATRKSWRCYLRMTRTRRSQRRMSSAECR